MRKPTDTEISSYYGHELYARLNGKKICDCEQCLEIRPKLENMLWKQSKQLE